MILFFLILWLLAGALLAWLAGRRSPALSRWISLLFPAVQAAVLAVLWLQNSASQSRWWVEANQPWIPQLGAAFHFGLDGLSLLLCLLTAVLGIFSVAASWKGIQERVGFFHFNVLWVLAALTGIFLSLDLLLFYFFWEMVLIPLYLLIAIWGHENRHYAALKFFIFTQAGGLFLLLATVGLYWIHGQTTGVYTFDYMQLIGTALPPATAFWLMLGFGVAFAVKLPALPIHSWLPDAHAEAPTAGSVILAGLVLKAGAYGFLRFLIPLFPDSARAIAPWAMALGVAGILYGALLAFAQTDLKRMIAYTSVSHMGFVLLGAFAGNAFALQGAVVIILSHGLSTGALFILAGALQDRLHTRDLKNMGGLWSVVAAHGRRSACSLRWRRSAFRGSATSSANCSSCWGPSRSACRPRFLRRSASSPPRSTRCGSSSAFFQEPTRATGRSPISMRGKRRCSPRRRSGCCGWACIRSRCSIRCARRSPQRRSAFRSPFRSPRLL